MKGESVIYSVQVYINQFRGYKLVDQVCVTGYGGKYKHTVAYPVTQVWFGSLTTLTTLVKRGL